MTSGGTCGSLPGGADSRAVANACSVLAPLGQGAVLSPGSLGALTTYRVGGEAAVFVTAAAESDLELVSQAAAASGLPLLVVGRGSNLLVADRGFGGIAVSLGTPGFASIDVDGSTVRAGAAVPLPALARQTVEAALTGFEWAVGVPGSLGGAVRMNAGGHGSDMAACLRSCRVIDLSAAGRGAAETLALEDLDYHYRSSSVRSWQVVVSGELALRPGDPDEGRATIREIVRWRREHQPGGQNAGSVFTNPPGEPPSNSAGWLIERAGQKGRRFRSAMVSTKHANFIQADPGGSADDVLSLLEIVRDEVARRTGEILRTEVRLVGFDVDDQRRVEG